MKFTMLLLLMASLPVHAIQIGDFLRNSDGTVKTEINHWTARALCKEQGKRLPTARELAIEGTKYGGKILELKDVPAGTTPKDFRLISTLNSERYDDPINFPEQIDEFYYNGEGSGVTWPTGDLGKYFVWSSSIHSKNPLYGYIAYFAVGPYVSYGLRQSRTTGIGIRCVDSQ